MVPLGKFLKSATFYNQGLRFGTLEIRFGTAEVACVAFRDVIKGEKRIFYPYYMGGGATQIKVRGSLWNPSQKDWCRPFWIIPRNSSKL